jgi:hypothetical protein
MSEARKKIRRLLGELETALAELEEEAFARGVTHGLAQSWSTALSEAKESSTADENLMVNLLLPSISHNSLLSGFRKNIKQSFEEARQRAPKGLARFMADRLMWQSKMPVTVNDIIRSAQDEQEAAVSASAIQNELRKGVDEGRYVADVNSSLYSLTPQGRREFNELNMPSAGIGRIGRGTMEPP